MDDSKIIDALGGTAKVARLCKIKSPSVSGWRTAGIPSARRQFLEVLRPDLFAAERLALATGSDAEPTADSKAA